MSRGDGEVSGSELLTKARPQAPKNGCDFCCGDLLMLNRGDYLVNTSKNAGFCCDFNG